MTDPIRPVAVRSVPVEAVRPLRHSVLRRGWPEQSVHTERDDDPDTVHLAAFDGDAVIGVVTMFPEPFPPDGMAPAERFRWMAVEESRHGTGTGRALMREVAAVTRDRGLDVLWAHGRDSALGFYEHIGFRVVGDGYTDVTNISHHLVVIAPGALLDD